MRVMQNGFTLIEILVSLIILSIALLGMAGLQILSIQSTTNALNRSQATMVAYDLAERMKRNKVAALNNRYDTEIKLVDGKQKNAPASPGCINSGCTADQLAKQDIREWLENLIDVNAVGLDDSNWRPVITDATAQLTRAPNSNQFSLIISWQDNSKGTKNTQQFYSMGFAL